MEGCRLTTTTTVAVPSSVPPRNVGFAEKPLFLQGQAVKFPCNSKRSQKCATKFRFLNIRAQVSGTPKVNPKTSSKDENLAFVAGATGRVGSRAVRELLKLGFQVRAGVRSVEKAQTLVQSVKQMNASGDTQPVEKLEIVQCDLEKKDQIGPALGNASVVLCCIGASEKEVFDISGPYRIDYVATKNLIEAATVAKVDHFILLTSLGTNKVGFPAAILNLFWGVLIWKRKAEEALLASGLPYTIVRPGGMERPTDAYKETHNITLSLEDTLFGGQVSNLQVAELMACMAKNRGLSYCKVVEVIAETTAPLTPMEELLKNIPSQRAGGFASEEPSALKVPDLVPSTSEEPKSSAVEEPLKAEETAPRPLSPYTAYEDLKLPTSPSPTPSTTAGAAKASVVSGGPKASTPPQEVPKTVVQEEVVKMEVKKLTPSSPYTAYEDLKPPSSPSPTPSGNQKPPPNASSSAEIASPSLKGNDATNLVVDGVAENGPPKISAHCHSPFPAYEDWKPPTSPSPSQPSTSKS